MRVCKSGTREVCHDGCAWSRMLEKMMSKVPHPWEIAVLWETRELKEMLPLLGGNRASPCCIEGGGGNGAPTTLDPWLPRAGTGAEQPHILTLALGHSTSHPVSKGYPHPVPSFFK